MCELMAEMEIETKTATGWQWHWPESVINKQYGKVFTSCYFCMSINPCNDTFRQRLKNISPLWTMLNVKSVETFHFPYRSGGWHLKACMKHQAMFDQLNWFLQSEEEVTWTENTSLWFMLSFYCPWQKFLSVIFM